MNMKKLFFMFAFLGFSVVKAMDYGGGRVYGDYLNELRRNGVSSSECTLVSTEGCSPKTVTSTGTHYEMVFVCVDNSDSTRF